MDLQKFKTILLERRYALYKDVQNMEENTLRSSHGGVGNLAGIPTHIADISTDTYEQHLNIDLLQNGSQLLRQINEALERIENGSFGKCEECGKQISPKRLEYVPQARLCVTCQQIEEERYQNDWGYY